MGTPLDGPHPEGLVSLDEGKGSPCPPQGLLDGPLHSGSGLVPARRDVKDHGDVRAYALLEPDDLLGGDLHIAVDQELVCAGVGGDDAVVLDQVVDSEVWLVPEVLLDDIGVGDDDVASELVPHPLRRDGLGDRVDHGHERGGLHGPPFGLQSPYAAKEVPVAQLEGHGSQTF